VHTVAHQRDLHTLGRGQIQLQPEIELCGRGGEDPGPVAGGRRRHRGTVSC
jgi:hypothetical protein